MKKPILIIAAVLLIYDGAFAGMGPNNPAPPNSTTVNNKSWLFKPLASNDVSLEVERIGGNVMMYLFSKTMTTVDMIYVEKSTDPTQGFTFCKSIKVSDHLQKSKNYIGLVDDKPMSENVDCYYRIRTVSASGYSKVYPVVSLSPILPIEPSETVENR